MFFWVLLVVILALGVSLSFIPKKSPTWSGESRTIDRQNESNVVAWTCLDSFNLFLEFSRDLILSSISAAALLVNVSRMTSPGETSGLLIMFS